MMKFITRAILIALAVLAFLPRPAAAATSNWMRDYVQKRQAAQIERVLGREAANDFLRAKASRIVGGTAAAAASWPGQVALRYKFPLTDSNRDAQFCGGTLVHARFVVTAAHCSDFISSARVQVVTGTKSLLVGGTRHDVKRITVHPLWNDVTFSFDIAVWELTTPVVGITPASMIIAQQEGLAAPRDPAFVTGWGSTFSGGPGVAWLRQVLIPIQSRAACNARKSYDGEVTPQMICAGPFSGGRDACQGDSGGPLWVRNGSGQWIVAGITSWGFGCARRNFPGVYTRLAIFSAWARQVIANAGF